MKSQSVEGFIIARAFLAMYKEDGNKMNEDLSMLYMRLNLKVRGYIRKKYNVNKMIEKAWNDFLKITGDEDASVQAIPFCLRLIIKNPNQDTALTTIALRENKMWLWRKEEEIVKAKKIVDQFYNIKRK